MARKRGRTSIDELMTPVNPLERQERPDAPYELDDEAANEWRAIVSVMPAEHFMKGNYPLLVQYCRHIVAGRRVAQLIDALMKRKKFDSAEFSRLLSLQNAESQAIQRLARSMRLTQQSVMRAETTKHPKHFSDAPWIVKDEYSTYTKAELGDDEE